MIYKQLFLCLLAMTIIACNKQNNEITEHLKFPYDMCEYDNGILVSNLGGDTLNYFNQTKQTGFISYHRDGNNSIIIPHGTGLYSPKGIAIKDNYLFVADINKIVVFDLKTKEKIDEISFPQGDAFVTGVLVSGSTLFVSVTNYNKIYLLNIENPEQIDHSSLLEYIELPYPSTLKIMGEYLLVCSNSFVGAEYEDQIIHIIDDLNNPSIRPIIHEIGDYQGLAFTPNKTRLIFCNQNKKGYIGNLIFENGQYHYEQITDGNSILTSLLMFDNRLYISDLGNSKIFIKDIIEFDNFANIIETQK